MNIKKAYKELVETTKKHLLEQGLPARNEDIAKVLGYTRSYFSTLLGKKGNVTEEHIRAFKLHFPAVLENPTKQIDKPSQAIQANHKEKYDELLERRAQELLDDKRFFQDLVKSNLTILQNSQDWMHAKFSTLFQRNALVDSSGDEKEASHLLEETNRRNVENYVEVQKRGIPAGNNRTLKTGS